MKKFVFMIVLFLGTNLTTAFGEDLRIPMQIIDPEPCGGGNPLAPARPWYITQDDNDLTLPALSDDYTLMLLDEDGNVAYTTFVPAGTTSVVLPSTLSGDFELRLVADTYYYRGYINL